MIVENGIQNQIGDISPTPEEGAETPTSEAPATEAPVEPMSVEEAATLAPKEDKKVFWIIVAILFILILAAGGYLVYTRYFAPVEEETAGTETEELVDDEEETDEEGEEEAEEEVVEIPLTQTETLSCRKPDWSGTLTVIFPEDAVFADTTPAAPVDWQCSFAITYMGGTLHFSYYSGADGATPADLDDDHVEVTSSIYTGLIRNPLSLKADGVAYMTYYGIELEGNACTADWPGVPERATCLGIGSWLENGFGSILWAEVPASVSEEQRAAIMDVFDLIAANLVLE